MAKAKKEEQLQDYEKEFLRLFNTILGSRSAWQVWEDFITVMACSISNAVDRVPNKLKLREEKYEHAIKNLGGVTVPAQLFRLVVEALEQDQAQDFLGNIYMELKLGNHWRGQVFTPYHICEFMANLTLGESMQEKIEKKGYVSVYDPCVGAGSMLIAAANVMKKAKINYQENAIFIGQDIDRIVAMMAYIQISLIGCPGYILIGDSLVKPPAGHVLFPGDEEGLESWITPMFITDIWNRRCQIALLEQLLEQ